MTNRLALLFLCAAPLTCFATPVRYELSSALSTPTFTTGFGLVLPDFMPAEGGRFRAEQLEWCGVKPGLSARCIYATFIPSYVVLYEANLLFDEANNSIDAYFPTLDLQSFGTYRSSNTAYFLTISQDTDPVTSNPEPATFALALIPLAALVWWRRRRPVS